MTFSKWLLKKRGFTSNAEFARILGFSLSSVDCWLYKNTMPRLDNLIQIVCRLSTVSEQSAHELWQELTPLLHD